MDTKILQLNDRSIVTKIMYYLKAWVAAAAGGKNGSSLDKTANRDTCYSIVAVAVVTIFSSQLRLQ